VFDRLYPPLVDSWKAGREKQRLLQREAFAHRATELFDTARRRIGMAALGVDLLLSQPICWGIATVNGFRADDRIDTTGYLEGAPNRASRDKVDLVADRAEVCRWLRSQEQRLRDLDLFTIPTQLELAYLLHNAFGSLAPDHCVGMTRQGLVRFGEIEAWAQQRDEIFLTNGTPLMISARPPRVTHHPTGAEFTLPENCFLPFLLAYGDPFPDMFPSALHRDPNFEFSRNHAELTWEKFWWRLSGHMEGSFLKAVCRAWSCDIGAIVAPLAHRQWSDALYPDDESLSPIFGYRLNRP